MASKDDQLVNAKAAKELVGVASSLPDKKCVTYGELQDMLDDVPKGGNAQINTNYGSLADAIDNSAMQMNLILADLTKASNIKNAHLVSGYGNLTLTPDIRAGWAGVPNASGWQGINVYTTQPASGNVFFYRYCIESNKNWTYKSIMVLRQDGSWTYNGQTYTIQYTANFNESYDMNSSNHYVFYIKF